MDKEKILAMSREENANADPYELQINHKAGNLGAGIALLLCIMLWMIALLVADEYHYELYAIYLTNQAVVHLYKAKHLHKMKNLVFGTLFAVVAIAFIVKYLIKLFTMH